MCLKIAQTGRLPAGFLGFDIIIIALLIIWIIFSYCINGWGNARSLNHTVAYIVSFLLFYVAIKFTLNNLFDKSKIIRLVLKLLTYTTILNALYACIEFVASNFIGLNLNDYVPRPSEEEAFYDASVLELFYRARGFAPESGHFTFMMELFLPYTLYYLFFSGYCKLNRGIKIISTAVIAFSFLFAVSSASFVIIPLSFFIASLISFEKSVLFLKARLTQVIIFLTTLSSILFVLNYLFPLYSYILLSLSDKLDSTSFDDRQSRIDFFFYAFNKQDVMHKLYGAGPAGFDILGFDDSKSILSLYYSITFELGFIGLLLLSLLFVYFMLCTINKRKKMSFFSLVSIIAGVMHYYFIANFWYPWFWFVGAFIMFSEKNRDD